MSATKLQSSPAGINMWAATHSVAGILRLSTVLVVAITISSCQHSQSESAAALERMAGAHHDSLDIKLRCADVGRRYHERIERERRNDPAELPKGTFAYNAKLNTCLYRGGFIAKGGVHMFIIDLATNETVVEHLTYGVSQEEAQQRRAEFEKRSAELMGH